MIYIFLKNAEYQNLQIQKLKIHISGEEQMNLDKTNCILNENRLGGFLMLSNELCICSSINIFTLKKTKTKNGCKEKNKGNHILLV